MSSTTAPSSAGAGQRPIVVSGPSGTGKSTLLKRLLAAHPTKFGFSVSHTTRAPRAGEVHGKDYHFVSKDSFLAGVQRGEFVEHAEFSGNHYGTTVAGVEAVSAQDRDAEVSKQQQEEEEEEERAARGGSSRRCILDIDSQGVLLVKKTHLDARFLFVAPPSMEELERRLRSRQTDSDEAIERRLAAAEGEMALARQEGVHDLVIVNDDLERAYAQFEEFCTRE